MAAHGRVGVRVDDVAARTGQTANTARAALCAKSLISAAVSATATGATGADVRAVNQAQEPVGARAVLGVHLPGVLDPTTLPVVAAVPVDHG
jgi:hypothetical protein